MPENAVPIRQPGSASKTPPKARGIIEGAGEVVEQQITATLEQNYMPYAMSVILSRCYPGNRRV